MNGDEATTASADARFVRWVITERRSDRANSIQVTDLVLTNGVVAFAESEETTFGESVRVIQFPEVVAFDCHS